MPDLEIEAVRRLLEANTRPAGLRERRERPEVWDDMIHVWHLFHQQLAAGCRALAEAGGFIRSNWGLIPNR